MRTRQKYWVNSSRGGWAGWILACAAVVLIGPANTFGQSGRGSINGSVMDPSNAMVPGAKIVVTNIDTGQSREAVTVDNGTYVVPLLPVGNYKATCSREGFQTETRTGIILTADDKATVDFSLKIGQSTQTVEVSAGAELINTATGAIGQLVDQRTIVELPLNGRNPAELVFLAPGAVDGLKSGGFARQYYTTFPTETAASVNGGLQGSVYYMLDGASNMDTYHGNAQPFPNPDATGEFRVLTNNFDAQYGFSPGAVVSIVTKSGTNSWHGDAFEFIRNEKLNARDFFVAKRDILKRNQFGASVGGPIVKDKLFIFGNYQGTTSRRTVAGGGVAGQVPNNKMLTGDFSDECTTRSGTFVGGICTEASGQLRDPDTGVPYPNNFIDPATFSPVAMNFINLTLPRTDDPNGFTPFTGRVNRQDFHEFTIRPDWYITPRNHISGRVFYNYYDNPSFNGNGNMLIADRSWNAPYHNYSVNWASTISSNLINNFVFSYGKLNTFSQPGFETIDGGPVCGACMGMNIEEYPDTPANLIMWTNGFWATQNTNYINRHNVNLSEAVTWTKGKHTIVGGLDYYYQFWDLGTDWLADPLMGFDNRFTGGSGFSDFMLGRMAFFQQGAGQFSQVSGTSWAPYFQDSIRLKPNFTLNLGLRWEPYIAYKPSLGRIGAFRPGEQSTRFPNAPVGLVYPGDTGVGDGGTRNTYNNLSPRFSFAWQPGALPNTSIRGSFGIFMAPGAFSSNNANADTAPFAPSFIIDPPAGGIPFEDPWSVFAPTGFQSPFPPFASADFVPASNSTFILPATIGMNIDRDYQLGRVQTWNFSVERQFAGNTLIRAAYVGTQSYHLPSTNQSNPGIFPTGARSTYPDFSSINTYVAWGVASYHGLQFTFDRKFSRGLQFTSNYSWSKGIDNVSAVSGGFGSGFTNPFNPSFDRGLSGIHFPHIWTSHWVYQLPGFSGSNRFVSSVLGNWQLSGIYRLQSGRPFSIGGGGGNKSGTQLNRERADVTGQAYNVHQGDKGDWLLQYFNPAAFAPTALGTFGTSGRNILAGPGTNVVDLGIFKNIPFKERYRVQFRMQMYNAFNRPHFDNPNNNVAAGAAFGRITSTAGYNAGSGGGQEQSQFGYPARIIELGLKLHW